MKMRWILCGVLVLSACHRRGGGAQGGGGSVAVPRTDDEKTLYALGVVLAERIGDFNLSRRELAFVERGMLDQITGAPKLAEVSTYAPRLRQLAQNRQAAQSHVTRERGAQFADRAAHEAGAQRTASGMVFRELQAGNGAQPTAMDEVTVNYRGTLIDGTQFDSSYDRHQPATFTLSGVIRCWTEGLQLMHVGGRARLVCPPDIAYGDRGQPRIPAGSTLVFEVELISIRPRTPPPAMMSPLGGPTGATSQPAASSSTGAATSTAAPH